MSNLSLVFVALGLAMDAFAVALIAGLKSDEIKFKHALVIAVYFGIFQGAMPVLGWLLGSSIVSIAGDFHRFLSFLLLAAIGVKMIYEAKKNSCSGSKKDYSNHMILLGLAVATSIDAFAAGISLKLITVDINAAVVIIGGVTFMLSLAAVYIGKWTGCLLQNYAELTGGILLIAMGLKILLYYE